MKSNLCSSPISLASPLARMSVSSRSNTRVLSVVRARLVVQARGSSPSLCLVGLLLRLAGGSLRHHDVEVLTAAAAGLSAGATGAAKTAVAACPSPVDNDNGDGASGGVVGLLLLVLPLYKLSNSSWSFSPSARTYAHAINNGSSIVEAAVVVVVESLLLLEEGVDGSWLRIVHLFTMAADMTGTAAAIDCGGNVLLIWFPSASKNTNALVSSHVYLYSSVLHVKKWSRTSEHAEEGTCDDRRREEGQNRCGVRVPFDT